MRKNESFYLKYYVNRCNISFYYEKCPSNLIFIDMEWVEC